MQHPIGTRIRFKQSLVEGPNEDHPAIMFARCGELGTITGHGTIEGYWVTTDNWPTAFGASDKEFEIIQ